MKFRKFSIILSSIVFSSASYASIINGIDDAYFSGETSYNNGSISPKKACEKFNYNVSIINQELESKYPGVSIIDNLCRHFSISDYQIENTIVDDDKYYSYWFEYWTNMFPDNYLQLEETIDIERTIDILMFSGSSQTNYVMLIDGSAVLAEQKITPWYHGESYTPIELTNYNVKPMLTKWGVFTGGESLKATFGNTVSTNMLINADRLKKGGKE